MILEAFKQIDEFNIDQLNGSLCVINTLLCAESDTTVVCTNIKDYYTTSLSKFEIYDHHFLVITGFLNEITTSDDNQSNKIIKKFIAVFSFCHWKLIIFSGVECTGEMITLMTTKQLYCIAQGKYFSDINSLLRFLQPFLVGNGASLMMNTPAKRKGNRDSCNVEHDYYQNIHWWHLFGINSNGTENPQAFYVWKVNNYISDIMFFMINNQSFIHSGEQNKRFKRIKFPVYTNMYTLLSILLSSGYQISFLKRNSIKVK